MLKRILALSLGLVCLLSTACGEVAGGQPRELFLEYYKEDIDFINENTGTRLLPLVLSKKEGGTAYVITGDVLSLSLLTDETGDIITRCEIRLTAPLDMAYGSVEHNDFTMSGYHSYALLMAMEASPDAYSRYGLVTSVVEGMADDGLYSASVGDYTLECVRDKNMATLLFTHSSLGREDAPVINVGDKVLPDEAAPSEQDSGVIDEGAGVG